MGNTRRFPPSLFRAKSAPKFPDCLIPLGAPRNPWRTELGAYVVEKNPLGTPDPEARASMAPSQIHPRTIIWDPRPPSPRKTTLSRLLGSLLDSPRRFPPCDRVVGLLALA